MFDWILSAGNLVNDSLLVAKPRTAKGPRMVACTACGKLNVGADMSAIPNHGVFCNEEEAKTYWQQNFELRGETFGRLQKRSILSDPSLSQ